MASQEISPEVIAGAEAACSSSLSPEPAWSASLHCAPALDEGVKRCLLPLAANLEEAAGERLWWLRYGRGGPHLKIRVHASAARAEILRRQLEVQTEDFLSNLPPAPPYKPRAIPAPAIDPEDESEGSGAHALRFTTYRRSPVSLGPKPLIDDDETVRLLIDSLGRGCAHLAALWPQVMTAAKRRQLMIRLLLEAAGSLDWNKEIATAYFSYHRDGLLRAVLTVRGEGLNEKALKQKFDARTTDSGLVEAVAPALITGLEEEGSGAAWALSLRALQLRVADRYPEERLDAFAPDASFSALFKALHGLANALGQSRLEEAFAHHICWTALHSSSSSGT